MKLTFLFLAAVVLCVSATPLAETPAVRNGCDSSCQTPFMQMVATCKTTIQQVISTFSTLFSGSWWFTSAKVSMITYSNTMNILMLNVQNLMSFAYGQTQLVFLTTYINNVIMTLSPMAQIMVQIGMPGAETFQQQVSTMVSSYQQVLQVMSSATTAAGSSNTLSLMALVNATTVQTLTTTIQQTVTMYQSTMQAFQQATVNQTSAIGFYLMDAVMGTNSVIKAAGASFVQQTVQMTCSTTQTSVSTVISGQVTLMQSASSTATVSMTISKSVTSANYQLLINQAMYLNMYVGIEASFFTSTTAELEQAHTELATETATNITQTQDEFTAMCQNSTDAQNITQTITLITTKITQCAQASVSVTVQMCANVAVQALLVTQTKGHQGIGQCVSAGKAENDKDMEDVKQSYKQSSDDNQQNMKHCADRHKEGGTGSGSDSGETPTQKCESCKKKHCDKGKGHKDRSHEKCKKHKKGGENYNKVQKCKEDCRTQATTEIQSIIATFNICASVTITL